MAEGLSNVRFWGASTSAFQVEGNSPSNQWHAWMASHAREYAARDRNFDYGNDSPIPASSWPELSQQVQDVDNYQPGNAADFWNRYPDDMALARNELGHNAIRFSIEWGRLQPERGRGPDEDAVEHYRRMIRTARELGLEPFVGLWHWTEPDWFTELGSWENPEAPEIFADYVYRVVSELKDDLTYVIVLNETEVFAGQGYANGQWPPGKKSLRDNGKVMKNLVEAYRRSYDFIKSIKPTIQVSAAINLSAMEAASGWRWPLGQLYRFGGERLFNGAFLKKVVDKMDWIGLNYYMRFRFGRLNPTKPVNDAPDPLKSDLGWELFPPGLYKVLIKLRRYGKPVIITEHGLADHNDSRRPEYIRQSLEFVDMAIKGGVNVIGYLHWSLLDNFEWDKGRWPRFGLIAVDYETQERTIRPSAYEYRKIIKKAQAS